ncbi:hypothetical protein Poli38472_009529 [Pythium oligandrum]|uniref:Uncharacterized protein n=1 Tax=Pythium oligandrum TaxID=41045 RepID=A0A8K1CFS4_PYTOL|nr:hypothetical protein Poli38472_009529 [Pythium oligandrum]|eukprot:TMW62036.1 hypothetical protein Poli38472_009529 [Pythium oligandrum]
MTPTSEAAATLTERLMNTAEGSVDVPESNGGLRERTPQETLASDVGDVEFRFARTFEYMTGRRLQRRYRGVYKQYSFTAQIITWFVVLCTLSVLAAVAFGYNVSERVDPNNPTTTNLSNEIFYLVLVLVLIYLIVRVALVIRWIVYWAVFAALVGYAIMGDMEMVVWAKSTDLSEANRHARYVLTVLLVVAECLTVAIYVFTHYFYPWLVINGKFNTIWWWSVKRSDHHANTLTYRSRSRFYTRKRHTVTYTGGLDEDGRPHGYGMWTDTSFHGERLTGQWEHGLPIGPYRSFEHGSGYCFVKVRVGYCHNRAEERPDQIRFFPKHSSEGLHWGVTSVECSVSGGFFTFLPSVDHLTPIDGSSEAPQSAADCIRLLQSPVDSVVYQKGTGKRLGMSKRFKSAKRLSFSEMSNPVINVASDPVLEDREALVLLHGYNCSLDYGLDRLGQLLALGDFPTSIHPFIFSWPSGGSLAYFQARTVGSESDRTAQDFRTFLRSLVDAGYTTIHIIAHSMGARVYFHALNLHYLDDVFEIIHTNPTPREVDTRDYQPPTEPVSKRARLATLTFANADYDLKDFVKYGGGYDLSRRFCDLITLYADGLDGALFFSEIFSKKDVCGTSNFSIGRRPALIHRNPDELAESEDNPVVPHRRNMDAAISAVNQRGNFEGVTGFAYNHSLRTVSASPDLHRASIAAIEKTLDYLDMDVIDTTWMDNNVHSLRHNYFNLNPTVVDDIRNLIVSRRRAASRRGLLQTMSADNVYIFLVAPSHVKNK